MAGYSQTPLVKKLGFKEGQRVRMVSPPEDLDTMLSTMPDVKMTTRAPFDVVLLFVNQTKLLESWLFRLRSQLNQNGMVWVCWYKKASKKQSEITEDIIRDTALPLGFVDVKVCAVSEAWSGLKLVIRVSERI